METIIGKEYIKKVIPLIENAKSSIKIVVFFWGWYGNDPSNPCQLLNASILRAVKRGVRVQACVNSQKIASPLKENGIEVNIPVSKSIMHTKMIIVDSQILVIGSHNFSQSAFTLNFETSVILKDYPEIKNMVSFFDSIFSLKG